jgi:hypothetical protein
MLAAVEVMLALRAVGVALPSALPRALSAAYNELVAATTAATERSAHVASEDLLVMMRNDYVVKGMQWACNMYMQTEINQIV